MTPRREFLRQSLAAFAGGSLLGRFALTGSDRLPTIGLELYTVRSEMEKSVEATLERVAKIGYGEVEFAGYFGKSRKQIADVLKATGLKAPAAHVGMADIRKSWAKALDDAATIGHQYLVCASIDGADRTPGGMKKVAEEFNAAAATAKRAGIRFGYHNHDFEFKPASDGSIPYDTLLASTDPALVLMEMDLYWITKGKQDPLAYWAKYPGRFHLLHVKDMMADGSMADVGAGQIPFAKYFRGRATAGATHFFVEHDEPGEPFASIETSYRYLKNLTF